MRNTSGMQQQRGFVYTVRPQALNKERLVESRTNRFVYTVRTLNKEYLGDAGTKRFAYTVRPLNKEHLGDARCLSIQ